MMILIPGRNEDILKRSLCLSVYQTGETGLQGSGNFIRNLMLGEGKGTSLRRNLFLRKKFQTVLNSLSNYLAG